MNESLNWAIFSSDEFIQSKNQSLTLVEKRAVIIFIYLFIVVINSFVN